MTEIAKSETGIVRSASQTKLDRLLKQRTMAQKVVLLLDVSGSMTEAADTPGERRIDALRGVVNSLRLKGITFKQACFESNVTWSDVIPEPFGGTNMSGAFEFIGSIKPEHVIVISDGQPDNMEAAKLAAQKLACKVDVFYVGPSNDIRCKQFLESLATSTGGSAQACSFAELEQKVAGVLTAGGPQDEPTRGPIAL